MQSWAKEKGELWFGTSKGTKAMHIGIEKQMFGKRMFAGPSLAIVYRKDFGYRGFAASSLCIILSSY